MKKVLFGVLAVMLMLCINASAKKMVVWNFDKGELFGEPWHCEQALSEEHAAKGKMMLKVVVEDRTKPEDKSWWIGGESKKIWDGFDVLKFKAFNPGKKPLSLWIHFKMGTMSCPWDKRFCPYLVLKPGDNDCEIELMGACSNDGTAVDWKQKIASFAITSGPVESFTFYLGNMTLETAEDEKKK